MRAFVFTDRALERQAGRFVWLSIDAEKERNAPFLEKYPIEAFPTFLFVDPDQEQAAFRWLGGASVAQLEKLLDDGERALHPEGSAVAEADRLMGARKGSEAAAAYRDALAKNPAPGPDRDRVVESLLTTLGMTSENEECVRIARAELPAERNAHFASVAAAGLGCALSLEGDAKREAAAAFEPAVREVVLNRAIAIAVDDRSALFGLLVDLQTDRGDKAGARKEALAWLEYLDGEAARAADPRGRAVFDPHRLSAAIEAGVPERAVGFLSQSEKDFPEDYNPPARLAVAYRELKRYDEGLAAADRALALVYGPRKIRVFSTRADILDKKGDTEGALQTLRDALRYAETLPRAQISERSLESLRQRVAKAAEVSGASPPS